MASVYYCPSPEEYHRRLWDLDYGCGKFVGEKILPIDGILSINDVPAQSNLDDIVAFTGNSLKAMGISLPFKMFRRKRAKDNGRKEPQTSKTSIDEERHDRNNIMSPPIGFQDTVYERLKAAQALPGPGIEPRSQPLIENTPLPRGTKLPNAIFARKHQLVPKGITLPEYLIKGKVQPTADQLAVKKVEHLLNLAAAAIGRSCKGGKLKDAEKLEFEESIMKEYFSYFMGPFTPSLFYDSGLDFNWYVFSYSATPKASLSCPNHWLFSWNSKRCNLQPGIMIHL